jgi:hypothetical protein
MRRISFGVGLFSALILLSGTAGAQKTARIPSNYGNVNGGSLCDATAGNLVTNCGFETGNFSAWIQSGDLSYTAVENVPHSGIWAVLTGPVGGLGYISQNLPTDPDGVYNLTFWLANSQRPNRFQVSWDGVVIFESVDMPDFFYTLFELNGLVASTDSTELKFGFYNDPDYFAFDDVVVVAAP